MCYDAEHDCLIGFAPYDPNFYAFRYAPEEAKPREENKP